MYLLLLVFGAVLGAAGVVLSLSGVSLRDGTFDAAILTPGIVAAVGGASAHWTWGRASNLAAH
jgi:hypothetical protein